MSRAEFRFLPAREPFLVGNRFAGFGAQPLGKGGIGRRCDLGRRREAGRAGVPFRSAGETLGEESQSQSGGQTHDEKNRGDQPGGLTEDDVARYENLDRVGRHGAEYRYADLGDEFSPEFPRGPHHQGRRKRARQGKQRDKGEKGA